VPARVGTKERETSSYLTRSAAPVSAPGFSRIVKRAAFAAKVGDQGSSALSDACSYKLANEGLDTRTVQRSWDTGTFFANFMIANIRVNYPCFVARLGGVSGGKETQG
jgi:hypothetical protein